jgi:hypothetical protein
MLVVNYLLVVNMPSIMPNIAAGSSWIDIIT